ncbi:MAG: bifunctional methylenetetrahydrofolate dehydrogenase/methenyltetrahydrofolate cyclohydrolase FolD [Ruminococcus sp.]|jgi:methylenetetrahydrofolate dehydrogenase (NADP+)/methenyltetrahydrofolate cyclohydrolase|nr:bifunctional methylenetetrahydrofolate dehydrogenase/methenyltetrahydrofolate cyclohydrolase FolD [Ruminococcus sp.]
MSAKIISGKEVSAQVKERVKAEADIFTAKTGIVPGLAVIIVGEDPASQIYVRNKHKSCAEMGFKSFQYALPETTSESELLELIDKLNNDKDVHGILVQMPLPKGINENAVINAINPKKDVDAFHPENVGHIMIGDYSFLPGTPAGVMELLASENIDISGKKCVVIGRSNIVGKPMAMLLLHKHGTVTICHSRTKDLPSITREADILVAAIGKLGFVTADMVKEGAVVIDVGINRTPEGKVRGDVDYEAVAGKAGYITPVPGGVGPMTIAMLMQNTLTAAKLSIE